jgi:Fe-S-cluster containining protein
MHNAYTGEVKEVRVDPDKIALFEDESSIEGLPEACPFLRFDAKTGKAWCMVHLTRPDLCRDYCCWRLLILDARGKRAGRVMYQRTFVPDSDELCRLWEQVQPTLNGLSGAAWDDALTNVLTAARYRVRR